MFTLQFPTPQPHTSYSHPAPQDMYVPNLHHIPAASKAKRGPPKLSLQITSETRRIFTKSSSISLPPPPTSAAPMSPTALATMRNTQLNATRNDAAMAEEARRNGAGRHRRRRARVCFADGHEVIGYAHGPESAVDSPLDSASSSSEEDSSDDDRSPVLRQGSWGSSNWSAPPTRADRGFGYDRYS